MCVNVIGNLCVCVCVCALLFGLIVSVTQIVVERDSLRPAEDGQQPTVMFRIVSALLEQRHCL